MRRYYSIVWVVVVLVLALPALGAAQEQGGAQVVQAALTAAGDNCDGLGRDQACYGHALLAVTPASSTSAFTFEFEGDRVGLSEVQSLKLSGMDVDAGTWGVAMLSMRANLPSSRPENVTVLAFGDVRLDNAALPQTQAEVQVRTNEYVNVRLGPSTQVGVAGVLAPGQTVTALERLADTSWIRVRLPEDDKTGWLFTDLVSTADDLATLNVADRNAPYFEPMQAFYFESGDDANSFEEVPASGLLIQTPEGVGEVQLLINEINIQIGSTVYFTAQPGGSMTVATLEGHADVRAFGVEYTAFAGTQVSVPIDEAMKPSGAPTMPEPYDEAKLRMLPVNVLGRQIDISPPLSPAQILDEIQQQANENAGVPEANAAQQCCVENLPDNSSGGNGNNGNCPGESCNAPGRGGSCPGNSCDNPGRGGGANEGGNRGRGRGND